jgi:uncharacterized protein
VLVNELSEQEVRVLGCLVEKQLTTPQQYPLTLNALTLACNQTSNRDPVVTYDEQTVETAVTSAKTKGLTCFVHPSHGRSARRYAHMLGEALGLDPRQLALLAVLMLRGPQTPGELRSRTERMERFEDLGDLEAELERMAQREEPLVLRLPRRPGQKEERYATLLGPTAGAETAHHYEPAPRAPGAAGALSTQGAPRTADREEPLRADAALEGERGSEGRSGSELESLQQEVWDLKAQLDALRKDLDDLRSQLGA